MVETFTQPEPPELKAEASLESPESNTETSLKRFDAAFLKEIGIDKESREQTLITLESMFGDRIFHHDDYHGTVREVCIRCPAFGDILEQGAPSAAAWLEANDQPQEEKKEDDDNKLDAPEELHVVKKEPVTEQVTKPVNESSKVEKLTQAEAKTEPVSTTKSETNEAPYTTPKVSAEVAQNTDTSGDKSEHISQSSSSKIIKAPVAKPTTPGIKAGQAEPAGSDLGTASKNSPPSSNSTITREIPQESIAKEDDDKMHSASILDNREKSREGHDFTQPKLQEHSQISVETSKAVDSKATDLEDEIIFDPDAMVEEDNDISHEDVKTFSDDPETENDLYLAVEGLEELESPIFESDILIAEDTPKDTIRDAALTEMGEDSIADNHPDTETILDVMMNEIVEPTSEVTGEYEEIAEDIPESKTLLVEVLEILSELIPETPELTIEASAAGLRHQAASTIEAIGVLEKSKTAEECREALKYIRIELANLLMLLGYKNADTRADQLVKQYGMQTLKEYITLLMKSLAQSQEVVSGKVRQANPSFSPRHYGVHAVRTVVSVTLGTPNLQAA